MSTEQVSEAGGVSIPHEVIAADMRADFGFAEMEDRERVSVDQAAANLAEWKIIAVKCADAVTAAEKALVDAKAQRRECDLQEQAATQKLLQARRESELLDGWKQAVAEAFAQ